MVPISLDQISSNEIRFSGLFTRVFECFQQRKRRGGFSELSVTRLKLLLAFRETSLLYGNLLQKKLRPLVPLVTNFANAL